IGSAGRNDDGVFHGAEIFERLDHLGDGGALLADGNVDTNHVAALLVDNRVERDGGLTGLAVADDELALAAADRDHAIDGFDAGLERLLHGLAVDRIAERVHHAADQGIAHRHGHDFAGAAHFLAFTNAGILAEQHRTDLIFFEVHGDAENAVPEGDELACHDLLEAMDTRDTVADGNDGADFAHVNGAVVILDLLPENISNLVCPNLSHRISSYYRFAVRPRRIFARLPRT